MRFLSQFIWENADDLLSNEKSRLIIDRSIIISTCATNICPGEGKGQPAQNVGMFSAGQILRLMRGHPDKAGSDSLQSG